MKIEAGKYYLTRDGRKVGPMVAWDDEVIHKFQIGKYKSDQCTTIYTPNGDLWNDSGYHCESIERAQLITEWEDEPDTDYAALAAKYGIKITVQVGEIIVEYDGRK